MGPHLGLKRVKRKLSKFPEKQQTTPNLLKIRLQQAEAQNDQHVEIESPVATCSSIVTTPRRKRKQACHIEPVLTTNFKELSVENVTENTQNEHLPIIKSASKTDLKEQEKMKKLRSSSFTLQGIENKQENRSQINPSKLAKFCKKVQMSLQGAVQNRASNCATPIKRRLEDSHSQSSITCESNPKKMKKSLNRASLNLEDMNIRSNEVRKLSNRASLNFDDAVFKHPKSEDFETVSLASTDTCFKREDSTRNSWRNRLRKMASIGAIFASPKVSKQLKRSSSLHSDDVSNGKAKMKKFVQLPTPVKRRPSKLWLETVADFKCDITACLTTTQIRRQEAIFELYCGEEDLIEDLKLLKEVYFNEMAKLNLLNEEQLSMLFGNIEILLPLHEDLLAKLKELRNNDGSIDEVGKVLINWIPGLRPYVPYCAQQMKRKYFLDNKFKEDPAFADFLQRCLESPFSRKLDLWSFLDAPRNRLVKYPLLFSTIEKLTLQNSLEKDLLSDAIKGIEEIISQADKETGWSKCEFLKERLYFVNTEHSSLVESAKSVICDGCLRNRNGAKLEGFLFDTVFVLARPATRRGTLMYQVSIEPMSLSSLRVEEVGEGDLRKSGSFKNSLSRATTDKNLIRVSSYDSDHPKSYTLQARDDHNKKQWLNCFKTVLHQEDP